MATGWYLFIPLTHCGQFSRLVFLVRIFSDVYGNRKETAVDDDRNKQTPASATHNENEKEAGLLTC